MSDWLRDALLKEQNERVAIKAERLRKATPEPPKKEEPSYNPNLKDCEVCGKQMAKGARTCPHCGKTYTTSGGIFLAILIGLAIGGCFMARR